MSKIPLDKQINAQWFGTKLTPAPSAKVVEGKVKAEEVPKVVDAPPPPPVVQPEPEVVVVEEPTSTVVEQAPVEPVEVSAPREGKKRGAIVAKLGVPVAAAVVAWAFIAKSVA